jgi:hypothetical protein
LKNRFALSFINEPGLDAESRPENKRKGHLVSGAFISPYRAYTNLMQGVFECELVLFCEAAAGPQGWPPPKHLFTSRRFLIANDISLLNRPT